MTHKYEVAAGGCVFEYYAHEDTIDEVIASNNERKTFGDVWLKVFRHGLEERIRWSEIWRVRDAEQKVRFSNTKQLSSKF